MEVTIYHNPRCSKSRQTLELIRQQGIEPTVVEYLKTPPSTRELARLLDLLGLQPRELMRKQEPEYKAENLDDPALSHDDLVEALHTWPKLIERPIVVAGGRAVIGRPPERVKALLGDG